MSTDTIPTVEQLIAEARESCAQFDSTPGWHIRTLLVQLADALHDRGVEIQRLIDQRDAARADLENRQLKVATLTHAYDLLQAEVERRERERQQLITTIDLALVKQADAELTIEQLSAVADAALLYFGNSEDRSFGAGVVIDALRAAGRLPK